MNWSHYQQDIFRAVAETEDSLIIEAVRLGATKFHNMYLPHVLALMCRGLLPQIVGTYNNGDGTSTIVRRI